MTQQCTLSNSFGVTVQAVLALMVLVVLMAEYAHEYFCHKGKHRKILQFWFDTYKICSGALISHIFNMAVSRIIGGNSGTNECAVYALAFYYEATGVPFVQLLQYGVIHYATVMSKSENTKCNQGWKSVSEPGIYPDTPNKENSDHGLLECCYDLNLVDKKNFFITLIVAALFMGVAFAAAFFGLRQSIWISFSFGFLGAIFSGTLYLAPRSSHWQVLNWMGVKSFEKTLWSGVAIGQESFFRQWAREMSTGNPQLDAWLFIAIIPIVMNAFMFFMFSRISRLKIPCMNVAHRGELDEMERRVSETRENPTMKGGHGLSFHHERFDIGEAVKVGIVYTIIVNTVLYAIAIIYIESKKPSGTAAGVLFVTMIVFPVFVAAIFIALFNWLIQSEINCCCCCCCGWYDNGSNSSIRLGSYTRMEDEPQNMHRGFQELKSNSELEKDEMEVSQGS